MTEVPPAAAASRPSARHALDPQAVLALRDLELRARVVVEGLRAGLHRSPFTGFSVEFTEYRQYTPGDDLRYLDWRVLARTDRHVLRKYEDETNLRCWLLLDVSRSMSFGSRPGVTKADYARTLVAALAWFLHEQRDVVGVASFDATVQDVVPPRWRPAHLRHILATLAREPAGRTTDLGGALRQLRRLVRRRSLVILVSDFLSPVVEWSQPLSELAAAGHDVRALQILDPAEVTLDGYGRAALWEDLESGETRYVDPAAARRDYLAHLAAHNQDLRRAFEEARVGHRLITTAEPLDLALVHFIRERMARPTRHQRRQPA